MPYGSPSVADTGREFGAINADRIRTLVIAAAAHIDQPYRLRLVDREIGSCLPDEINRHQHSLDRPCFDLLVGRSGCLPNDPVDVTHLPAWPDVPLSVEHQRNVRIGQHC